MFTMCFLDKIVDYKGIDGVLSADELLQMVISQLEVKIMHEPDSTLIYFVCLL